MRKSLIILFLTVISVSRLTSQGLTWENRDNNQILQISETTNPDLTQSSFDLAGVQQESDSIFIKKSRYYYHGHPVRNKEFFALMKTNREANVKFQGSFALRVVGAFPTTGGSFLIGYSLGNGELDKESKNNLIWIGAGCWAVGFTFMAISGVMQKKAVEIYNQGLNKTSYYPKSEVRFGFVGNGIGMNYRF